MSKADRIEMDGEVIDINKGVFVVKLDGNEKICDCTLSGKMRINSIRIVKGDRVTIDLSPYDLTKGRIIFRSK